MSHALVCMNLIGMEMSRENFPLRMSSSQLGLLNLAYELKHRSSGTDAVAQVRFVAFCPPEISQKYVAPSDNPPFSVLLSSEHQILFQVLGIRYRNTQNAENCV
jgi:hypothetical protein